MTENCRVKTATSFGCRISAEFELRKTAAGLLFRASTRRICSRRSASASACRLSALRSPEIVSPLRFWPLNVNTAINVHHTPDAALY